MRKKLPIQQLMIAIIQIQDADPTIRALTKAGLYVTPIASSGGFLGMRNVTLLIGLTHEQKGRALDVLQHNCRRRVEYIATPLEGIPFNLPLSTPITIGGATIFTLPVEYYEEIP